MSTSSTDTFEIGAGGGTRFFNGVLDDVRLYDRGLCAAEITAIFEEARSLRIVSWQEVEPN